MARHHSRPPLHYAHCDTCGWEGERQPKIAIAADDLEKHCTPISQQVAAKYGRPDRA